MASRRTIFIIDDDRKVLNLLEATLRLKDFKVVKREDPIEALGYLKENVPDLILAGVNLPGASGFDFFRRVRETTRAAYTPFILLGGADEDPIQAARGLRMGAEEFLRKPFSIDELLVRVEKVFEKVDASRTAQPKFDLEGRLEHWPIGAMLEFLNQRSASGRLTLSLTADPVEGFLVLQDGHVRHAVFGLLKGRPALLQLLPRSRGAFAFCVSDKRPVPVITMSGDIEPILEEGRDLRHEGRLRRIDVTNRDACRLFEALVDGDAVEPMKLENGVMLLTDRVNGADETETIEIPSENALTAITDLPDGAGPIDGSVEVVIEDSSMSVSAAGIETPSAGGEQEWVAPLTDGEFEMEAPPAGGEVDDHCGMPSDIPAESLVIEAEEATRSAVMIPAHRLFSDEDALDMSSELGGFGNSGADMAASSIIISARPLDEEAMAEEDGDEYGELRTSIEAEDSSVALVGSGPGPVETLFTNVCDQLLVESAGLGLSGVLIATRSGRPLASTLDDQDRQEGIAAFAAQAIQFAPKRELGTYAELSASDLHLVVVEMPYRRLLACIFESPPDSTRLMEKIRTLTAEDDA